jgi:hypothetical protein
MVKKAKSCQSCFLIPINFNLFFMHQDLRRRQQLFWLVVIAVKKVPSSLLSSSKSTKPASSSFQIIPATATSTTTHTTKSKRKISYIDQWYEYQKNYMKTIVSINHTQNKKKTFRSTTSTLKKHRLDFDLVSSSSSSSFVDHFRFFSYCSTSCKA